MITTSELINIVRSRLMASALKTSISGGIYKRMRPQSSDKEDVVINSLSANNEQLQDAVLNVNVFVPDQIIRTGTATERQPDSLRIEQLEKTATDVLNDITVLHEGRIIQYDVQQANVFKDDESAQHFINIRLQFNNINI